MSENIPNFRALHGNKPHKICRQVLSAELSMLVRSLKQPTQRFEVPDSNVDWKVPYIDYRPHLVGKMGLRVPQGLESIETGKEITYDKQGYPLNVIGRTGLCGLGVYPKWGENLAIRALLMRQDVATNKKQVLLWKPTGKDMWVVPGAPIDKVTDAPAKAVEVFGQNLNMRKASPTYTQEHVIYKGYGDHGSNTDNAWLGLVVLNRELGEVEAAEVAFGNPRVQWHNLNKLPKMAADQGSLVQLAMNRRAR